MLQTIPRSRLADKYEISRLIKGGWQLAHGHASSAIAAEQAISDMLTFVEAGVTAFDCADIYSGVEELIGAFRKQYKQKFGEAALSELKVHTKFVPDLDILSKIDKTYIERVIDRSLTRLGADCLDLVQLHWWDYDISGYVETAGYLKELQQAGKIRHIAATNFDVARLKEIVDSGVTIVSHQIQYSLLDRRSEHGMSEYCRANDIKLLCYGVLAGGFLSHRYLNMEEAPIDLANRSLTKYRLIIDEFGGWEIFQRLLNILDSIAQKHDASISQIAMRYILCKPQVAAVIVGAHDASHLQDAVATFSISLDENDLMRIDEVLVLSSGPLGDTYTIERDKKSPHASIMKYNLNSI